MWEHGLGGCGPAAPCTTWVLLLKPQVAAQPTCAGHHGEPSLAGFREAEAQRRSTCWLGSWHYCPWTTAGPSAFPTASSAARTSLVYRDYSVPWWVGHGVLLCPQKGLWWSWKQSLGMGGVRPKVGPLLPMRGRKTLSPDSSPETLMLTWTQLRDFVWVTVGTVTV